LDILTRNLRTCRVSVSVAIADAPSRHYVRCLSDATSAIVSVRWRLG
jgi:hypothetical protein